MLPAGAPDELEVALAGATDAPEAFGASFAALPADEELALGVELELISRGRLVSSSRVARRRLRLGEPIGEIELLDPKGTPIGRTRGR